MHHNAVESRGNYVGKVVVLGSDGMLGHDMVEGLRVVSSRHLATGSQGGVYTVLNSTREDVNLTNRVKVLNYLSSLRSIGFDTVVNCAAATDVWEIQLDVPEERNSYYMNALAPKYIAEACCALGMRLVHISTDYVYSEMSSDTETRHDEFPKNTYGYHKLIGELFVKEAMRAGDSPFTILRVGCLYGMHREKSFVHKFLRSAAESIVEGGCSPSVVNFQCSTPTSTRFVCDVVMNVLENGMFGTFTTAPSGHANRFEFAEAIVELANLSGDFPCELKSVAPRKNYAEPNCFTPSTSCMETINNSIPHLGYGVPWTWRDDLRRFFETHSKELGEWFRLFLSDESEKRFNESSSPRDVGGGDLYCKI